MAAPTGMATTAAQSMWWIRRGRWPTPISALGRLIPRLMPASRLRFRTPGGTDLFDSPTKLLQAARRHCGKRVDPAGARMPLRPAAAAASASARICIHALCIENELVATLSLVLLSTSAAAFFALWGLWLRDCSSSGKPTTGIAASPIWRSGRYPRRSALHMWITRPFHRHWRLDSSAHSGR